MSDLGLAADLRLDVRGALDQVSRLEAAIARATEGVTVRVIADVRELPGAVTTAIDAADTSVVVSGEAADLTGDVTAAIDAADTTATIDGDASQLTGKVTGAVDAADTHVNVTADAGEVTGTVTGAVDAADTHVVVTADSSGVRPAQEAVNDLGSSVRDATEAAAGLRGSLAALGIASAAAGIFGLIDAASQLEQSIGGTQAIFGKFSGVVDTFARGAADAAGLTEESARVLTAQIGGLLQGFDFTQEEAARTSVVLAQLGADLAATFGGSPEDAVRALGGALRGEFDPLERFGVSLNITQANLKAVELGLADSTSNVSLNARAQASLALIMERSAQAQGQFAREASTTAGQLERTKAEAGNAAATIGQTMQPALNELLQVTRTTLIPALTDLGSSLGPTIVRAVTAALPAVGTFSQLLIALEPVIRAVATVVEAIPQPVLQVAGAFIAFRAAAGPLGGILQAIGFAMLKNVAVPAGTVAGAMNTASTAAGGFRSRLAGVVAGISPVTVVLLAAAAAFTAYSSAQAKQAERQRQVAAQGKVIQEALRDEAGAVEGLNAKIESLIETGEDFASRAPFIDTDFAQVFSDSGATVDGLTAALEKGRDAAFAYVDTLGAQSDAAAKAVIPLRDLIGQIEDQAKAAIAAGVATDDWSQKEADAAIEATRAADGSRNYVAAQDLLISKQQEAAAAEEQQTQALTEQQKALQDLTAEAPALALLLAAITDGGDRSAGALGAFAVAADEAGLSGAALDAVVAQLGATSGPALQRDLEAVAAVITGVRDAGLATLPTLQDMAGEVEGFTLAGFRDELQKGLDAIVGFNENLGLIAEEGGPRLAAAAATLGPQYAAAIAEGLRSGDPEVAAQAEALLARIEQAGIDTGTLLTGTIGPNLAGATGQMGTLATTAFGTNFKIDAQGRLVEVQGQIARAAPGMSARAAEAANVAAEGFRTSFRPNAGDGMLAAQSGITAGKPAVTTAASTAGTSGKGGFEQSFKPDPRPAIAQARAFIDAGQRLHRKAGEELARQATQGFELGARRFAAEGQRAALRATQAVNSAQGAARSAGFGVGASMGAGIVAGINSYIGAIRAAAARAVAEAAAAARNTARIASPSRLFAEEVGQEMAAGIALGLRQGTAEVVAATAGLVAAAASPDVTLGARTAAAESAVGVAGAFGAQAGSVAVTIESGAIVIQGSGDITRDGQRAGTAALEVIRRGIRDVTFAGRTG